jgi:hypothetical protein
MQASARKNNRKQAKAVQNVFVDNDAETLHISKRPSSSERAKFQCNPRLEQYIAWANIIPVNFNFDWYSAKKEFGFDKALVLWTMELLTLSEIETVNLLNTQIEGTRFPIKENFPDNESKSNPIKFSGIALIQFLKIQEMRGLLRALVRLNISEENQTDLLEKTLQQIENKVSDVKAHLDSEGNVNFQLPEFAGALQGVNITRLRLCEQCDKLFWAYRKDAFSCSPKHARNRRMRLLRENWKEKGDLYIKARKKKLKKKKEQK